MRVEFGTGTATRQQIAAGGIRGRQFGNVHRIEHQLNRGEVLIESDHLLGHVKKLGRGGGYDLGNPDPYRRGLPDEVHVRIAAGDYIGQHSRLSMRERHAGQRCGVTDIYFRGMDAQHLLRAGQ